MKKILIVEDDIDINNMIQGVLAKAGYNGVQAFSGTEALLQLKHGKFNLMLLDLMLPGMGGEDLMKQIKPMNTTPVIVISAKDELDSKVDLLTLGAEDYITKPFEIKELLVRIAVQLRRGNDKDEQSDTKLFYKDLILDKETYQISISGKMISLTKQEYKICDLLLTYPNRVFSKQDIYDYAWKEYYSGEDKTINVHISNIRQKLKSISETEYIETVWGVGFKLSK